MNFLKLAKQRCSIRSFTDEPVEEENLDYILEAGQVAPTACNKQPQRIIVVREPGNIKRIGEAYKTFGAQCVLIVCRDEREALIRPYDQTCSGELDIGIVSDHMMLAAREKGVGSVMIGLFDPDKIRKAFNVPEYVKPTVLLILGYPRYGFLAPDRHITDRKPIGETVMMEGYGEGE